MKVFIFKYLCMCVCACLLVCTFVLFFISVFVVGHQLCNSCRRRKWTRWSEFKSWTSITLQKTLILLGKVYIQLFSLRLLVRDILCGIMVNMLNWCLEVSTFELQSCYYVHFQTNILGKGMKSLIPTIMS